MNLELEDYYRSVSSSMDNMVQQEQHQQQQAPSSEQVCYVRCQFCTTVLAVGIPYKRLIDTVTVKCGHCSNLSFLSTRPPPPPSPTLQPQCLLQPDHPVPLPPAAPYYTSTDHFKKAGHSSSSSSSTSSDTNISPPARFVVKPPEKKHRLPSAYNRFMKEEIQRIKAANPEIPHREAFSAAAKNWARYIPNTPNGSISGSTSNG